MADASNLQLAIRNPESPWLILGLGNPGPEYAETYHNVGFRVVRLLMAESGTRLRQQCGPSLISGKVTLGGEVAVFVEPQTFMNNSGAVLAPLFRRFEASPADMIVVYDDVALPLGRIRIRQKGSAGGHNGIKSIISAAGTDEFIRIRVGILPPRPIGNVRDFVLSQVAKSDRGLLEKAESLAAQAIRSSVAESIEKAMAAYNGIDLCKDGL